MAGCEKRTNSIAEIAARGGVPEETTVLQRGNEICPSANAAKAERNSGMPYAEIKGFGSDVKVLRGVNKEESASMS